MLLDEGLSLMLRRCYDWRMASTVSRSLTTNQSSVKVSNCENTQLASHHIAGLIGESMNQKVVNQWRWMTTCSGLELGSRHL